MPKFEIGDKILQISAVPNNVCQTAYDKGPSIGEVIKITPKMYRVEFTKEQHDIRIEDVKLDFAH